MRVRRGMDLGTELGLDRRLVGRNLGTRMIRVMVIRGILAIHKPRVISHPRSTHIDPIHSNLHPVRTDRFQPSRTLRNP